MSRFHLDEVISNIDEKKILLLLLYEKCMNQAVTWMNWLNWLKSKYWILKQVQDDKFRNLCVKIDQMICFDY